MASLNKCMFIGNVTKDIELRYLPNQDAVVNFSIGCNENWKDKDGNKHEKSEFVNVVMFRKLAEIAAEYLKKGRPVYIEGRLQTRKWQDKEGKDRYTTEIVAEQMQMLGSRDEAKEVSKAPAPANFDDMESDIPF